jgi:hypothetical protein
VGELKYRFNWNAPIVRSPHDRNTVYFGSSVVFKSTDFGKSWNAICPDLTTNDRTKQRSFGEGPFFAFSRTCLCQPFHRSTGLRAAVTSSTRLVRV